MFYTEKYFLKKRISVLLGLLGQDSSLVGSDLFGPFFNTAHTLIRRMPARKIIQFTFVRNEHEFGSTRSRDMNTTSVI